MRSRLFAGPLWFVVLSICLFSVDPQLSGRVLAEEVHGADKTVAVDQVAASASHETRKPGNTFDDDLLTSWSADGEGQWITFRFKEEQELESVDIAFLHGAERTYRVRIEVSSDGKQWATVLEGESSGKTARRERFEFEKTPAKHVRVTGLGNSENAWINISEIAFNGHGVVAGHVLSEWTRPDPSGTVVVPFGPIEPLDVWGGDPRRPVYFDELLPALFERTIAFDELDLRNGELRWIFTGELGGFTISIRRNAVELTTRFYDSPSYLNMSDFESGATGHPEWQSLEKIRHFKGDLQSLTVVLDHRLHLRVLLNGRTEFETVYPLEVRRHQLNLVGEQCEARGQMLHPSAKSVRLTVDATKQHQTMIGFGGITTPTAYWELSEEGKQRWWNLLCEYNLLIHREYPIGKKLASSLDNWDTISDARPSYYADNFPNGEITDFNYLKQVRDIGGQIWFEFWELPPWAQGKPKEYARAIVEYCRRCKEHTGSPPEIVGIQNENVKPQDVYQRMTRELRKQLDEGGFEKVKIHMADVGFLHDGPSQVAKFRADPKVWELIDYSAVHLYDYQEFFTNPDGFDQRLRDWHKATADKPFLSTELSFHRQRWQWPTYRIALTMGQLHHKNLTLADASALCYCWLLLNVEQPSYGWTRSLFVPDYQHRLVPKASSHQLRVFGAFSRRIHEGMRRVSTDCADRDLLVSAYENPAGQRTLVALNRSTKPMRLDLKWPGAPFDFLELVDPYNDNVVQAAPPMVEGGTTFLEVNPGAIVTLSNVPLKKAPPSFTAPRR
jgi:O-glycosyl hydrolase